MHIHYHKKKLMINSLELVAIPLLQPSKHWDYRVSHSIFFYFFGLKKQEWKRMFQKREWEKDKKIEEKDLKG